MRLRDECLSIDQRFSRARQMMLGDGQDQRRQRLSVPLQNLIVRRN
jgi:hypothetical protein